MKPSSLSEFNNEVQKQKDMNKGKNIIFSSLMRVRRTQIKT